MSRVIDEKSLLKKKAVGEGGEPVTPFKYKKRKDKDLTPEDRQVQALQNIAGMIERGLSQKIDYDKLFISISQAIIDVTKQGSKETENILRELAGNLKIEIPNPKPVTEIDVYKIERDHRGMMTGFKMRAKR